MGGGNKTTGNCQLSRSHANHCVLLHSHFLPWKSRGRLSILTPLRQETDWRGRRRGGGGGRSSEVGSRKGPKGPGKKKESLRAYFLTYSLVPWLVWAVTHLHGRGGHGTADGVRNGGTDGRGLECGANEREIEEK